MDQEIHTNGNLLKTPSRRRRSLTPGRSNVLNKIIATGLFHTDSHADDRLSSLDGSEALCAYGPRWNLKILQPVCMSGRA
jgi:hypothetical protein